MWWVCVQTFSLNYLQPLYYYNKVTENRHQSPSPPPPSTEIHTVIEINNRNSNLHKMKLITVLFCQRNVDWKVWKFDWMAELGHSGTFQSPFIWLNGIVRSSCIDPQSRIKSHCDQVRIISSMKLLVWSDDPRLATRRGLAPCKHVHQTTV